MRARRVPAAKARRSDRRESNIVLLALTAAGSLAVYWVLSVVEA